MISSQNPFRNFWFLVHFICLPHKYSTFSCIDKAFWLPTHYNFILGTSRHVLNLMLRHLQNHMSNIYWMSWRFHSFHVCSLLHVFQKGGGKVETALFYFIFWVKCFVPRIATILEHSPVFPPGLHNFCSTNSLLQTYKEASFYNLWVQ